MRVLFDLNHPADVHQFKFVIKDLMKKDDVLVVARDKECVHELLMQNKIPFVPRKGYSSMIGKAIGLFRINAKLYGLARRFRPDVIVASSGNPYAVQIAWLMRRPSVVFDDTEHSRLQNILTFPFATSVITPESYKLDLGRKQKRYPGTKELGYLSPQRFKPSKDNLKSLGPKSKMIFLRLVSWDASHDIGKSGIKDPIRLVKELEKLGDVVISAEGDLPAELKDRALPKCYPHIHDLLYYSSLVVSEGGTMAVESSILGTPTIYSNELRMGYSDRYVKEGRMKQITDQEDIIREAPKLISERKKRLTPKKELNRFIMEMIRCMI